MLRITLLWALTAGLMSCDGDDSSDPAPPAADGEGEGEGEAGGPVPCAAPGAPGNSKGVGEYCTRGGGECADNAAAFVCVVDIRPDANPICVMSCSTHEACGEDAWCTGEDEDGPKGCVPACMLDGPPPAPAPDDDPPAGEGEGEA